MCPIIESAPSGEAVIRHRAPWARICPGPMNHVRPYVYRRTHRMLIGRHSPWRDVERTRRESTRVLYPNGHLVRRSPARPFDRPGQPVLSNAAPPFLSALQEDV